jgi:hypothetical protein
MVVAVCAVSVTTWAGFTAGFAAEQEVHGRTAAGGPDAGSEKCNNEDDNDE